MKLNHLDLQVSDVPNTVAFFERYFGFEMRSNRSSPAIAILADQAGFVLVLQRRKHESDSYPDGFHFGFLVDDANVVRSFQARARADGHAVSDVIENARGCLSYCKMPDGYMIEVSWHRPRE